MATLFAVQDGSFTQAVWAAALSLGMQSAADSVAVLTTSRQYSPTFTGNGSSVAGVVLWFLNRAASPEGIVEVSLYNSTDGVDAATISIRLSHLPPQLDSLVFCRFASTVTLTNGKSFRIGLRTSSANQLSAYYSSSTANWTRYLLPPTTTVPAGGDAFYVVPQADTNAYTVRQLTMDINSITSYSGLYVGSSCTVHFRRDADTRLRLAGNLTLQPLSLLTIGTSSQPIPSTYTATLEMALTSNGQYKILLQPYAAFQAYGTAPYTTDRALLAADAASGATTLTVDRTTGWRAGDPIGLAPTGTSEDEWEELTLAADASGTTLFLDTGLSYAHTGTYPFQAEVINLRRNVSIVSTSSYAFPISCATAASFEVSQVYFYRLGGSSGAQRGIYSSTPHGGYGTVLISGCAFYSCPGYLFSTYGGYYGPGASVQIRDNVALDVGYYEAVNADSNSCEILIENNWLIGSSYGADGFELDENPLITSPVGRIILRNNRFAGSLGRFIIYYTEMNIELESNVFHTCEYESFITHNYTPPYGGSGYVFGSASYPNIIWDCAMDDTEVLFVEGPIASAIFQGWHILRSNNWACLFFFTPLVNVEIRDCVFSGGNNTEGLLVFEGREWYSQVVVRECVFPASAVGKDFYFAYADESPIPVEVVFENCQFGNRLPTCDNLHHRPGSRVSFTRINGTDTHLTYLAGGTVSNDSTIVLDAPYAIRFTPNGQAVLEDALKLIPVGTGQAAQVTITWYLSSAYTGDLPQLLIKANAALGLQEEAVLLSHSGSRDTWVTATATTPTSSQDTVVELLIRVPGSQGFLNVGRIMVS